MIFKSVQEYLREKPDRGELRVLEQLRPVINVPSLSRARPDDLREGDALWVARVENMYLVGEYALCLTPAGSVIRESSIYYPDFMLAKIRSQRERCASITEHKRGEYLALHGLWADSFGHWFGEYLPKALMAQACGFDGYYVVPPRAPYARESLELMGVDPDRIVPYDGKHWRVDVLYMPQPFSLYVLGCVPGLVDLFREKFLRNIPVSHATPTRIYVQRRQSRRVVNEKELLDVLNQYDFQTVCMEQLSFADQVVAAATAQCMLGVSGAGISHCLFMPPGSLLVELFSPGFINPCMLSVAGYLQHRYYMVTSRRNPPDQVYRHGQDVEATMDVIEITLSRELSRVDVRS